MQNVNDTCQWLAILCLSLSNILRNNEIRRLQRELNE
jgi:hypothetical protein